MKFFVLKKTVDKSIGETEFSDIYPFPVGEAPKCETCARFVGSLPCLPPYRIELELWNSVFGDIAFGAGGDILLSARFKAFSEELELRGLQGFDSVEVVRVIRHKRPKPALDDQPEYFRVTLIRSRTAIDIQQSGLESSLGPRCPDCLRGLGSNYIIKRAKRIIVDLKTWTGEDAFFARGLPGTRLVSERFKELMDGYRLTGTTLIPAEEYSFDFYPGDE